MVKTCSRVGMSSTNWTASWSPYFCILHHCPILLLCLLSPIQQARGSSLTWIFLTIIQSGHSSSLPSKDQLDFLVASLSIRKEDYTQVLLTHTDPSVSFPLCLPTGSATERLTCLLCSSKVSHFLLLGTSQGCCPKAIKLSPQQAAYNWFILILLCC